MKTAVALAVVVLGLAVAPVASAGGYTLALYQRLQGSVGLVAWTSGNAPKNATVVNTCAGGASVTEPVTGWTAVSGGFRALVSIDTSGSTGQQCTATLTHGGNSVASVQYIAP